MRSHICLNCNGSSNVTTKDSCLSTTKIGDDLTICVINPATSYQEDGRYGHLPPSAQPQTIHLSIVYAYPRITSRDPAVLAAYYGRFSVFTFSSFFSILRSLSDLLRQCKDSLFPDIWGPGYFLRCKQSSILFLFQMYRCRDAPHVYKCASNRLMLYTSLSFCWTAKMID